MNKEISLIVPFHDFEDPNLFMAGLTEWTNYPSQIIIVFSGHNCQPIKDKFYQFCKLNSLDLTTLNCPGSLPGESRNIGFASSNFDLIAFLDSKTFASKNWLQESLDIFERNKLDLLWGSTRYIAKSSKSKIIRASTYGRKPIRTLPGSIMKKAVFRKVGHFVSWARAGEDGDWISRAELHKLKSLYGQSDLLYFKLEDLGFLKLLSKWFRNYVYTSKLPYFRPHKNIYYYFLSFAGVLFAYNWNALFADWNTESIWYLPNITKALTLIIITSYFLGRGFVHPLLKGETNIIFLVLYFIPIAIFSFFIDIVKTLAFLVSRSDIFTSRYFSK
jgi:hypothetical protein